MPIAARSAPNNGRVKEAKVSSCTQGTGKALNGRAKRDVNRRANGDERRDIREDIRQAKREDENKNIKGEIRKGRREDKFGDKERNGWRKEWERGSTARPTVTLTSLMFQISSTTIQSYPNTSFLCSKFNTLNRHHNLNKAHQKHHY